MAKHGALFPLLFAALALLSAGTLSCARPAEQAQLSALPHGTCSISGKITDENGDPVQDATVTVDVHLLPDTGGIDPRTFLQECSQKKLGAVQTDSLGRYAIYHLPTVPEGQSLHLRVEKVGKPCADRLLTPVSFQDFHLDFKLTPGPWIIWWGGGEPYVDFNDCGAKTVVTVDPRTGTPIAHPY